MCEVQNLDRRSGNAASPMYVIQLKQRIETVSARDGHHNHGASHRTALFRQNCERIRRSWRAQSWRHEEQRNLEDAKLQDTCGDARALMFQESVSKDFSNNVNVCGDNAGVMFGKKLACVQ